MALHLHLEDLLSSAEGSRNTNLTQAPLSCVPVLWFCQCYTSVCMFACVHGHFMIRGWQSLFLVTAGAQLVGWEEVIRCLELKQCLSSRHCHQAPGATQHFLISPIVSPHLIQSDRWKMCSQVFCSKWIRHKKVLHRKEAILKDTMRHIRQKWHVKNLLEHSAHWIEVAWFEWAFVVCVLCIAESYLGIIIYILWPCLKVHARYMNCHCNLMQQSSWVFWSVFSWCFLFEFKRCRWGQFK